jgi:hypothetical protein
MVTSGRVFRAVSRHGTPSGKGISENVIWYVVRRCAERIQLDDLAPHPLRRTCAKLCHVNDGEVETDPIPPRTCFRANYGAISGMQAESVGTCKRPFGRLFTSGLVDLRSVHLALVQYHAVLAQPTTLI